jgi:hypothetical protein
MLYLQEESPETLLGRIDKKELLCVMVKPAFDTDYQCHFFGKDDIAGLRALLIATPEDLLLSNLWIVTDRIKQEVEAL